MDKNSQCGDTSLLYKILDVLPVSVYWKDTSGVYLGCNEYMCKLTGLKRADIIGKTDYDLAWKDAADAIRKVEQDVMRDNLKHEAEELSMLGTDKQHAFLSTKTSMLDDNEKTVGIIGISIDITDRKEKEHLQLKDETQKVRISEQEVFRREIGKLVHDGGTPIGTILMILGTVKSLIPEDNRISMVTAVSTLKGIFDNLRSRYKKEKDDKTPKPTIISLLLSQAAEGKRVQITNAKIEFTYDFDDCHFSFINVNQLALRRSITNLINNRRARESEAMARSPR
ncbi:hypothetical protein GAMM_240007 [Gammaproteobacteria bacterium]